MRPQEVARDVHVERVPQVARRMVERDVQHLEVGQVVLDLRALVDGEPEPAEDLGDPAHRLDDRMERAARDRPAGRGDVDRLGGQAVASSPARRTAPRSASAAFDRGPDLVGDRADPRPVLGRQAADSRAGPPVRRAFLAQDLDLERLEGGRVRGGRDRRQRPVAQLLELAGQAGQVQAGASSVGA